MGFLGNFIGLFSNAGLSILFIYVLAKYRKQSLKNFVVENRVESINILFNLLVAWSFLFIKLFGTITSVAAPGRDPLLFTLFHNLFGPIVTLNTFGDYIYVTRKLPKEILSTQMDVTRKSDAGGKKSIAGTGTKLSSTTA
ncbi:hypothetical protein BKA69DRAFT_1065172 [Paraphysoderma sedebokerense]|nr:hypothetical protein BKA69DRAFT_1065172 [Paraphysoderma sedebokerense]